MSLHSHVQKAMTFYIVRHGETDWNVAGRMQGHADIHLNDTGRAQAMDLAAQLKDFSFTSCYSSDLKRAHHTAEIILNEKNQRIEIRSDKRLRERDFRHWEGKLFADFNHAKPEDKQQLETSEEIVQRILSCLEDVAAQEKNGSILILTHGGVIYNLLIHLLELNLSTDKISVKNTGYVKLIFSENRWIPDQLHNIEIRKGSSSAR